MSHKYYNSGVAHKYSWIDIPISDVTLLQSLEDTNDVSSTRLKNETCKISKLVYNIADIINGGIDPSTGFPYTFPITFGSGTGSGSGSLLAVLQERILNKTLKKYIEEDPISDTIWVAEAYPGSDFTNPSWRVRKIENTTIGSDKYITVTWLGGTADFIHTIDIGNSITNLEDLF